jgi:hypothetical protein
VSSNEPTTPDKPTVNQSFSMWMVVLLLGIVVLALIRGSDPFGKKEPAKPDPKPGPPPIEFSFRKSQVPLKGLVAGVRNASKDEELTSFVIRVTSPKEEGERSHLQPITLMPQDSFTVGWMELDGWKLKSGDVVTVTCEQYEGEVTAIVSEP